MRPRLTRLEMTMFALLIGGAGSAILRLAYARLGNLGVTIVGLIAAFVTLSPDWSPPVRTGGYANDPPPARTRLRNAPLAIAKLISFAIVAVGLAGFYLVELGHCGEIDVCREAAAWLARTTP